MSSIADEHLSIVIVDDDTVFRELICATLAKLSKFVLFQAGSGDELFGILSNQPIECIVLDYDLGTETGLAIKQRLDEAIPNHPPTIMMTGDGRQSTAIRAFRMGVDDYLPKSGLRPEHLVSSVLEVVHKSRMDAIARAEHQRLVAASAVDIVTGLEGRLRLDERILQLNRLPGPARSSYALIAIEMLQNQEIAERFGLKTADKALRAFGQRLKGLTRSSDVCGRYEGGTFLLIVDRASNPESIDDICARLRDGLIQRFIVDAADLNLSARIMGQSCTPSGDPLFPLLDELRKSANAAQSTGADHKEKPSESAGFGTFEAASLGPDVRPAAEALRTGDRRKNARQRIFKRGLIHLVGGDGTLNCTVRNISAGGVGLRLESAFAVQETFHLEIVGSGARRKVNVRWQIGRDVGVAFVDPATE